ncbi:MAG: efflux RND transporter permease subunit, partial [Flavitalea sp.]
MWESLGRIILKYRWFLVITLLAATAFMAYHASKVELSYEFSRAIPTDNPKYLAYQDFRKKFGEDGNLLVIGIQTDQLFNQNFFNDYAALAQSLKKIEWVEDVLSIPAATNLVKDTVTEKLLAVNIFQPGVLSQSSIDSSRQVFFNLPFYQGILYNSASNAYLMGVRINNNILNSKRRSIVVGKIVERADAFGASRQTEMHYSGLPLIRTNLAIRVEEEMRLFLVGSILLSALILFIFFRSFSSTLLSLAVVITGVIWSLGTMHLLGYNITLLNALIPPLVVVIGIPNCVYFLNKYHTSYNETKDKKRALIEMVRRMGIVTLFCNIAAAIGFAVFALTKSAILKEFGVVAGINIMALFFISIILIPAVLSFLPSPKQRHTKY